MESIYFRPKRKDYTRRKFIQYLNDIGPALKDDDFIIGGIMRKNKNKYGKYLYEHDKIAFEVSYREWKNESK